MTIAPPQEEPTRRVSYGELVWAELRKNGTALFGLRSIVVLVAIAVYAPFLSLNQPLAWKAGNGWTFPFVQALFNRLLFENSVDVFFNLALVLSPLYALGYFVLSRRGVSRMRIIAALSSAHLLAYAASIPEHYGPLSNPLHGSHAVIDYGAEATRLGATGKPVHAVFPLLRHGYRETDPAHGVEAPSNAHFLGTDTEGRDVLARMLYGTRVSLTIGVVAVGLYVVIGVFLGALAGYFGGMVDAVISRAIEVMICFPSFFLILTLAALIQERSIFHVMIIIGITSWTGVARLVRAEFLKHKELEYAQAALALGIPRRRIIFGHILPNAIAPVLVTATFGIASAILIESSLSFLGIGDVTAASWGETLNAGRMEGKLWLIEAPGFAIFFVVTVFNLVGEGLRDALDPRLRS